MYKKVYVEITNNCNLKCSFCTLNKRKNKFISVAEFQHVLDELENYTKYLYFHVLGEPLLHPKINELIDIASARFFVNITSNGYLIEKVKNNKNIRQLNISLHSFSGDILKLDDYLNKIFEVCDILKNYTYISYRLWASTKYYDEILKRLEKRYEVKIDLSKQNNKLQDNIYLNINREFVWPSLDKEFISSEGFCYALKDHIAILVDGTVVPCCLDGDGIINLGNIYEYGLIDIINSKRYQAMLNGFKNNKKGEKLCQRCNFIDR